MSEDVAFKIQLGVFLPKLEKKVQDNLSIIIEDHIKLLRGGTLEGEETVTMEVVKEVVMKNLDIFLDSKVLPALDKKFNPVKETVAEPEASEVGGNGAEDEPKAESEG